jgi:vacuolar-type H+-ATPase subunit I/STV1
MFILVVVYFVIDSVRKLLDSPSYMYTNQSESDAHYFIMSPWILLMGSWKGRVNRNQSVPHHKYRRSEFELIIFSLVFQCLYFLRFGTVMPINVFENYQFYFSVISSFLYIFALVLNSFYLNSVECLCYINYTNISSYLSKQLNVSCMFSYHKIYFIC